MTCKLKRSDIYDLDRDILGLKMSNFVLSKKLFEKIYFINEKDFHFFRGTQN